MIEITLRSQAAPQHKASFLRSVCTDLAPREQNNIIIHFKTIQTMDKQKSIEALQFFVTGLSEGAFVHKVQGQIFKAQGFTKAGREVHRPLHGGDGMGGEVHRPHPRPGRRGEGGEARGSRTLLRPHRVHQGGSEDSGAGRGAAAQVHGFGYRGLSHLRHPEGLSGRRGGRPLLESGRTRDD